MSGLWIWGAAVAAYGAFRAWYDRRPRPLSRDEVERYVRRLEELDSGTPEERAVLRAFAEADDGREFLMLNLVQLHRDPVRNPLTGAMESPRALMQAYTRRFVRALLRRAGHPALLAFPAGGYVDTWGVPPLPAWTLVGMMRYRSRRDLMELITDPQFHGAHAFKIAAMPSTASFPMSRQRFFIGPRLVVGLAIALVAALGHLAVRG